MKTAQSSLLAEAIAIDCVVIGKQIACEHAHERKNESAR